MDEETDRVTQKKTVMHTNEENMKLDVPNLECLVMPEMVEIRHVTSIMHKGPAGQSPMPHIGRRGFSFEENTPISVVFLDGKADFPSVTDVAYEVLCKDSSISLISDAASSDGVSATSLEIEDGAASKDGGSSATGVKVANGATGAASVGDEGSASAEKNNIEQSTQKKKEKGPNTTGQGISAPRPGGYAFTLPANQKIVINPGNLQLPGNAEGYSIIYANSS